MFYKIALFLPVIGALMLFASMTIEWKFIINIRKSNVLENIKVSISNYPRLTKIGPISIFLILIPGIYMMAAVWKMQAGLLLPSLE
jgi:hypothetical protein